MLGRNSDSTHSSPTLPSQARAGISILLVLHFGLFATACASLFIAHPALEKLLTVAAPYLSPWHLRVDSVPVMMAGGNDSDWNHFLQWRADGQSEWQALQIDKISTNPARWSRLAKTIAESATAEDTATAAQLVTPLLTQLQTNQTFITASSPQIRVIALQLNPVGAEPETVPKAIERWRAALIRQPQTDPGWSLLTVSERRLSATGLTPHQDPLSPATPAVEPAE